MGLQTAVTKAVSANPQLAALLGWEVDVLAAAAETLASLVGLVPVEQRTSADFSGALDAVLSRLARESVGLPNVDADHRAAITGALAPILVDRIMNRDVPQATKDLWKIAVTRHGDPQLGDASAKEAGQVNRMLHLALPAFETVRATDWGAVVAWPLPWSDEELAGRMGLTIGQMLGGQFLVEKNDRGRCRARLVRIGEPSRSDHVSPRARDPRGRRPKEGLKGSANQAVGRNLGVAIVSDARVARSVSAARSCKVLAERAAWFLRRVEQQLPTA
jgi:hypothetical protein